MNRPRALALSAIGVLTLLVGVLAGGSVAGDSPASVDVADDTAQVAHAVGAPAAAAPQRRSGLRVGRRTRPASQPLQVVGLGDSVPAGQACGCTTYVDQVAADLAGRAGRVPSSTNLAESGFTTADVSAQLAEGADEAVAGAVRAADVVVVTVGANDLDPANLTGDDCAPDEADRCYTDALEGMRAGLRSVLGRVHDLTFAHGGRVVVTGYWNVFLDGDVGRAQGDDYVTASDTLTRAANEVIAEEAHAVGARYVDLYAEFKGDDGSRDDTSLLAPDGDHPDAAGHRLIAEAVERSLAA